MDSGPPPEFFGIGGWGEPDYNELRSLRRGGIGSLRVGINRASIVQGTDG